MFAQTTHSVGIWKCKVMQHAWCSLASSDKHASLKIFLIWAWSSLRNCPVAFLLKLLFILAKRGNFGQTPRIVISNTKSGWMPVTSNVGLWSIMGPVLYIIFINDLKDGAVYPSAETAELGGRDWYIRRSYCHPKGPGQAEETGLLEAREVQHEELWSPAHERNNHKCMLKAGKLEGSLVEKNLGVLVDTKWKWAINVSMPQIRLSVSWAALEGVLPAGEWRWSVPSI